MRIHVKTALAFAFAGILGGLGQTCAHAEEKVDPTGTWKVLVNRPGRPAAESTLKLEKSGDKLVGIMMDPQGRSTTIRDAQFKDGELSYRIVIPRDGRELSFNYKGKISADKFTGNASISLFGQNRSFPFSGRRLKPEEILAGLWKITLTLQAGQNLQPTLRLKQEGQQWTGGYLGTTGKELPLQDLKFKDGALSFRIVDVIDEDKVPFEYVGKLKGENIDGTAKLGEGKDSITLKFQAHKIQTSTVNLAGTWKLKVPFKQGGTTFEPTLKLTQEGNSFAGTYQGEQGETKIADGLIFGEEFSFEVLRERDGKRYRLKYQGRVKGESIRGFVDYDFDGMSGSLEFEGKKVGGAESSAAKKTQ